MHTPGWIMVFAPLLLGGEFTTYGFYHVDLIIAEIFDGEISFGCIFSLITMQRPKTIPEKSKTWMRMHPRFVDNPALNRID